MPPGYTEALRDGQSPRDYLLTCACLDQRDAPADESPKAQSPSSYHEEMLKRLRAERDELRALSNEMCLQYALREYEDEIARRARVLKETAELRARYLDTLRAVQAWVPPTPEHEGLKKFAISQIEDSLKLDCHNPHRDDVPTRKDGRWWRTDKLKQIVEEIAHHEEKQREELERAAARKAWIEALYASLDPSPTAK